jgi:hypothetical protein
MSKIINKTIRYPTDITVEYNTTEQYRECVRKIFEMDDGKISSKISEIEEHNNEKLDDITRDEIAYDEDAARLMLEYVYNETIYIPEFKTLYEKAAARMFSTDDTIGQAVLFSYDYFYYYHACLVEFFSQRFSTDFEKYRELLKLI